MARALVGTGRHELVAFLGRSRAVEFVRLPGRSPRWWAMSRKCWPILPSRPSSSRTKAAAGAAAAAGTAIGAGCALRPPRGSVPGHRLRGGPDPGRYPTRAAAVADGVFAPRRRPLERPERRGPHRHVATPGHGTLGGAGEDGRRTTRGAQTVLPRLGRLAGRRRRGRGGFGIRRGGSGHERRSGAPGGPLRARRTVPHDMAARAGGTALAVDRDRHDRPGGAGVSPGGAGARPAALA